MQISNSKRRRQAQALVEINELSRVLADRFPGAFQYRWYERVPLKIGICLDIAAALPVEPRMLSAALRYYTSGTPYLKALKAGAPRLDLDGNECGSVTEDEAAHALLRLTERRRARRLKRKQLRKLEAQIKPKPQAQQAQPKAQQRLGLAGLREAARLRKLSSPQGGVDRNREAARRRKAQNVLQV